MFSTCWAQRERREGGLAVPTGTLAFSGDSGTRARPLNQKVVQTIFWPIPFSHAPFRSNDVLHLAKCLHPKHVYLTNFLWWGEKQKKKILLKVCCTTAFLLFWETAAARGGHLEIDTQRWEECTGSCTEDATHNARAKIMWSVPVPLFMLVSVYKYIYMRTLFSLYYVLTNVFKWIKNGGNGDDLILMNMQT